MHPRPKIQVERSAHDTSDGAAVPYVPCEQSTMDGHSVVDGAALFSEDVAGSLTDEAAGVLQEPGGEDVPKRSAAGAEADSSPNRGCCGDRHARGRGVEHSGPAP